MKRKYLMAAVLAAALLSACAGKPANENTAFSEFTPNEAQESSSEEKSLTIEVESESGSQTVKVNVSPELKAEAEEYAAYVEMQEDKIGILSRSLSNCKTYSEYESLADQIISIAEDVKGYPVPEDNESLKEITASAMDEVIRNIEDSLTKARENLE